MKKSKEEEIQELIRKRVLEEYKKREEAKEIELQNEANIEALHDVTGLPKEEIQRIADQVRKEMQPEKSPPIVPDKPTMRRPRRRKKRRLMFIGLVVFAVYMFNRAPFFDEQSNKALPQLPITQPAQQLALPPADVPSVGLTKGFCSAPQPHKDYRHCDMERKVFKNADLTGSNFEGIDLNRAIFTNCNLTGVSFKGASLERAAFKNSLLVGNDFSGANLDRARFVNTHLTRVNFSQTKLERANFQNITLNDVQMRGTHLERANFRAASLNRVDFSNAELERSDFNHASLNHVVFTGANLKDVDLSKTQLNQVTR